MEEVCQSHDQTRSVLCVRGHDDGHPSCKGTKVEMMHCINENRQLEPPHDPNEDGDGVFEVSLSGDASTQLGGSAPSFPEGTSCIPCRFSVEAHATAGPVVAFYFKAKLSSSLRRPPAAASSTSVEVA